MRDGGPTVRVDLHSIPWVDVAGDNMSFHTHGEGKVTNATTSQLPSTKKLPGSSLILASIGKKVIGKI